MGVDLEAENVRLKAEVESLKKKISEVARANAHAAEQLVEHIHELEEKNEELEAANRLKSQFLATMSHELRTPLNAVIGFSRLLMRKLKETIAPRQFSNLEQIHESGKQLLSLVNDMLDLERIESGVLSIEVEQVELGELLGEIITSLQPSADLKEMVIRTDFEGTLHFRTDPKRLRQILVNLITNAIKYAGVGVISVEVSQKPDKLEIAIRDQGAGISSEDIAQVFDPFHQLDGSATRREGGVGLGLSIVKKLSNLLGGYVGLESEPGQGACFTVTLPLEEVSPEEAPVECAGTGPLLLVIDDNRPVREILLEELSSAGFRVHTAPDGKVGLQLAAQIKPDLIILDIVMPRFNGWEVLEELRKDPGTAGIPVVVFSMLDDVAKGYDLGVAGWLGKPFEIDQFHKVFSNLPRDERADVLVVEDDQGLSSCLCQELEEQGNRVRVAHTGEAALVAMEDRLPGLVVLDLGLPDRDGLEVLASLRKKEGGREIPVLIFTGRESDVKRDDDPFVEVLNKRNEEHFEDLLALVASRVLKSFREEVEDGATEA